MKAFFIEDKKLDKEKISENYTAHYHSCKKKKELQLFGVLSFE